jgi:hypothetical protein
LRNTVEQLPDFVRVAAEAGIREVYLQRLEFFAENAIGIARPDQALYEQLSREEAAYIDRAAAVAASLGITFSASGATADPGMSLKRHDHGSPWSLCRRPWTVMYITANGRALPCCIAPFSQRGYENYTLGDATQQTLREIWTGRALFPQGASFRETADRMRQLRLALELVAWSAYRRAGICTLGAEARSARIGLRRAEQYRSMAASTCQAEQSLRGWSNYFGYGSRGKAYRSVDQYVIERVRRFLARRHKVQGHGNRRFTF